MYYIDFKIKTLNKRVQFMESKLIEYFKDDQNKIWFASYYVLF